MRIAGPIVAASPASPLDAALRDIGDWLQRNQRAIRRAQWMVVGTYAVLLIGPVLLPLPTRAAHIWNSLTLFAQFAFWGIWWPFVLISMVLVGRMWCGLLCPEGTLTEVASAASHGRALPRWLMWKGWPFAAFAATTVYGQMISVYQYPGPTLVVLGISTVAAVATGLLWGRNKRVWCRFLCPVTGVFAVLSKLAPVHFRVDGAVWDASANPALLGAPAVNCAPLVPLRTMRGAGACHMCGRCSSYRGAITLARRSPNHEIVYVAGDEPKPVETALILFGLLGIAAAAFHWSNSALFIDAKQMLAAWLVEHGLLWPLQAVAPWWILTNFPAQNDVMTLLDGTVLLLYIAAAALVIGVGVGGCVAVAAIALGHWSTARFHHLVQGLIPLAGCGVFLGLSMTTITLLRADGVNVSFAGPLRAAMLAGAALWSLWLFWKITGVGESDRLRRLVAMAPLTAAVVASTSVWASLFWKL